MGQTLPVPIGTPVGGVPALSALTSPLSRVGVQTVLPQSGALSLRMPKLEPPRTSR